MGRAMTFFDVDLLHPTEQSEKRRHKLKRLVQSPNSYFMDVKCPGCFSITTVFSNAQTVVLCGSCSTVLWPADRWQVPSYGGLLLQEEGRVENTRRSKNLEEPPKNLKRHGWRYFECLRSNAPMRRV